MIFMLIYGVLTLDNKLIEEFKKISIKTNNLFSFYDNNCVKNYDFIKTISNNILVDSGAFSMINSNLNVNFDDYFKKYLMFVKKITHDNEVKGFFELDIGKLVPYSQVIEYRNKLQEYSDKIIPVWHLYLGVDEFKKLVHEHEYIAIGGIVSKEINKNKLAPYVKYAHKYNVKIHGLGVTSQKILDKVPFDSVDSSSWVSARFGRQYTFENGKVSSKKIDSNYLRKKYFKVNALSYINFMKFQKYYYNKWRWYHND